MPPPRAATEARSGSLEPGRPSLARSANTRHSADRPHTPPADRMYATDVRQTDVRQHHPLMPPERGHKNDNSDMLKWKSFKCILVTHDER